MNPIRVLALAAVALMPSISLSQGAKVAFGGIQQDISAPVEIAADSLSVDQQDGTATYAGNVVIGQGDMRLAAPRVMVVYSSKAGRIDRLEASGGVTLVNGAEAAEANQAIYSIDRGTITMVGSVLLTQGQNALTAERMVVNLKTGTAEMSGRVRTLLQTGGD
ncbi:MAG: LptA/OstA family protein [Rhodobacteraceae bacterium]|nr:LptA/OstA family protein [Paracoccaceae bacterium]